MSFYDIPAGSDLPVYFIIAEIVCHPTKFMCNIFEYLLTNASECVKTLLTK